MSGTSFDSTCPRCGNEEMNCSNDYKPHDMVSGDCLKCGFMYYTIEGQMTLEEVNELRKDQELEPLVVLEQELGEEK